MFIFLSENVVNEVSLSQMWSLDWWIQTLVNAYHNNPVHLMIESVLVLLVLWLFLTRPKVKPVKKLSRAEEEELIRQWQPEAPENTSQTKEWTQKLPPLFATNETSSTIRGRDNETYIQFASHNFLGFANHPRVKEVAKNCIATKSLGSCSARGFLGTFDVHMNFEDYLREYFGRWAMLYSDYLAVNASVMNGFTDKTDLLVIDDGVQYLITKGALFSRTNIKWFKHNDMNDLEKVLLNVSKEELRHPKRPLRRKYIVTEGVFNNFGDICNLRDIIRLKEKYKFRLIIDDSFGLGVIHPKGSPGYWNIPMEKIDFYICSMSNALGSTGGFCLSDRQVIRHSTILCAGYLFSTSGPPYQVRTSHESLLIIEEEGKRMIDELQHKAKFFRNLLKDTNENEKKRWFLTGDDISPIIHLRINNCENSIASNIYFRVSQQARENGILIFPNAFLPQEWDVKNKNPPVPSLRFCVVYEHTEKQLQNSAHKIREILISILDTNNNHDDDDDLMSFSPLQ